MKNIARRALPGLMALGLILAASAAWAFEGTVQRVADGDTITVEGVHVRLFGIDAPELAQLDGREARDYLSHLALGKRVDVREKDIDAYGRTVAVVLLPDGSELNSEMVRAGHAWVYRNYCRPCYGLRLAETAARLRGLGLWADPAPVPPWQWRKHHRRNK
ncbi:thermonuclease family protein [Fundidesulfovibrio agrisoli]|uniref:thermonuclease family protein n=1 Tax=Fundidesulfovibrio agrisoli TaxID=2922717 RepID=UPI001FAC9461|nr:thermonuclease family protein [Fundidesulfovibrio agrisoli]